MGVYIRKGELVTHRRDYTYIFLGRPIVELVWLHANVASLLELQSHQSSVSHCLVDLVLL